MKRLFLIGLATLALGILAACSNSTEESKAQSDKPSETTSSSQDASSDSTNMDSIDEASTESSSAKDGNTKIHKQADSASKGSKEENSSKSDVPVSKKPQLTKDEYLKKLNEMEEEDRHSEVGETTVELEKQEAERYKKWDKELNEIYAVLKEQLSPEQMDKVREEQRNWVKERDETAKESSLKYKGGTYEALEYVATQASLTRERCYALVAKYMS
ncbi:hypothetical protein A8F94_08140 [Bacillus sp. FJAT-27225]|uniref:lysozyme inhibitor LprI family protein n=1 Tax=Bacillus sp. FJAT-27225 TaxID=1743144 RepID=UPI00080C21D3|nr:lysozyme inhibitor LprI family protein [Bacillus sp. FJAT-27225]OCA87803.1 hypothetical protein A8F94_08140 [Bacillus sp. FJAT-27225]